ncbi:hypothetical protein [Yoonia sp.]|uniref:hypothetical protein n=1 Tax=Yoonia sp. TaxID=2212373 RepID=UPI0025E6D906|nr:hypothetical protein [Yoonia sp.]
MVGQPGFAADNAVAYSDLWGGFPPPPVETPQTQDFNYSAVVDWPEGEPTVINGFDFTQETAVDAVVAQIMPQLWQMTGRPTSQRPTVNVVDNGDGTYTVNLRVRSGYHLDRGHTASVTFSLAEQPSAVTTSANVTYDAWDQLAVDYKDPVTGAWVAFGSHAGSGQSGESASLQGSPANVEIRVRNLSTGQVIGMDSGQAIRTVNQDGTVTVGFEDRANGDGDFNDVVITMRGDVAGSGRVLHKVDGEVTGDTPEAISTSAGVERIAILHQAMVNDFGDEAPNFSAQDVLTYVQSVYDIPADAIGEAEWPAFFDANIDADGNLATDLDVSMFTGVDSTAMERVITDGAGLFYSIQQQQVRQDAGITTYSATALTLADDPAASQRTFVRALNNDMFQSGTSDYLTNRADTGDAAADALTNSRSQDFSVVGISHESIINGGIDEGDLANHAGVKALVSTGNELITEMEAMGEDSPWDGPTLEQLDSDAILTDPNLAVFRVSYSPTPGAAPVDSLVTYGELMDLIEQDKNGDITLHRGAVDAGYTTDPGELVLTQTFLYDFTYVETDGTVVRTSGTSLSEYDALIVRVHSKDITIVNAAVTNVPQIKAFYAQRAMAIYDNNTVVRYNSDGDVISGQSSLVRLAQNFHQQYTHFESAGALTPVEPFTNRFGVFGHHEGTAVESLLSTDPIAGAPTVSDAEALAFMFEKMGVAPYDQTLSGFIGGIKGITDRAQLAGHWAQEYQRHPDHQTAFSVFGGSHGNKQQAEDATANAELALVDRGRNGAAGFTVLTDKVKEEINDARFIDGFFTGLTLLSLGSDAAAIAAARTGLEVGLRDALGEEGASLLETSLSRAAVASLEAGASRGGAAGVAKVVELLLADGEITERVALKLLSATHGALTTPLGVQLLASTARVVAVGATKEQILQGNGTDVTEVRAADTTGTLDPDETGGLSANYQLQAVNLAEEILIAQANGASNSELAAMLYGDAVAPTTGSGPETPFDIVQALYGHFGMTPPAAIPDGAEVSREDLGISDDTHVHVNIGGEGPVDSYGLQTGFDGAINLQAADGIIGDGTHQTQDTSVPIPNLVRVESWDQDFPFAEGFADTITMQNAPLYDHNVEQIARMINKDGGTISLWIDRDAFGGNVEKLAAMVGGEIIWEDTDEFGGAAGSAKITIQIPKKTDTHAGVIEQVLDILPPELAADLEAQHTLDAAERAELVSAASSGDAQTVAALIAAKGSPKEQYDAFFAAHSEVGGRPQSFYNDLLAALPPETAANLLTYEVSSILLGTNNYYSQDEGLNTSGPLQWALIKAVESDPTSPEYQAAGAILQALTEQDPMIAGHLLYSALKFFGAPDGSADNKAIVENLLTAMASQGPDGIDAAGSALSHLDEVHVIHGRQLQSFDFNLPVIDLPSLTILDDLWSNVDLTNPAIGLPVAAIVGLTAAYVKYSSTVSWDNLQDWSAADAAATTTPTAGDIARNQFLNDPFAAFDDPVNGAELGEFALYHFGYENASQRLNEMTPEQAAANLDKVSFTTFQKLIAGMDMDKALAVQPLLAGSQSVLGDDLGAFAQELSDITGIEVSMITAYLDGTMSFDDIIDNGLYNVVPILFDKIESGDAAAIKFVADAAEHLKALGGTGDPDGTGGYFGVNEQAFIGDLADMALGQGAYAGQPPSVENLGVMVQLLSAGVGAAIQIVREGADLKYIPEAIQKAGMEELLAQNPELQDFIDNYDTYKGEYLDELTKTEHGRALLDSYGYQVIDGELYHAPRMLQNGTDIPTDEPSDAPSWRPSSRPSSAPTDLPSGVPSGSPTTSPTSAPTKLSAAEAASFIDKHVRFDIAAEFTVPVGPGATVNQLRVFVTAPTGTDAHGNTVWGLRLRQLTSVGPEFNGGDLVDKTRAAVNWLAPDAVSQLVTQGYQQISRLTAPIAGFARTVGNNRIGGAIAGTFQRFIPSANGENFGGDFGFVAIRDIVIPFIPTDAQGPNINTGFQPDVRYQSSVSLAVELLNGTNSAPYQLYNWLTRDINPPVLPTTVNPNEVVSLRHAQSNYDGAEAAYVTAVETYDVAASNSDTLVAASDASDAAFATYRGLDQDSNVIRLKMGVLADRLDTLGDTIVDLDPGLQQAASDLNDAIDVFNPLDDELDSAVKALSDLVADGVAQDDPVYLAAQERAAALSVPHQAAYEIFSSRLETFNQLAADETGLNQDFQTGLADLTALKTRYDTARTNVAAAYATYGGLVTTFLATSFAFANTNPQYRAAVAAVTIARDVWAGRDVQLRDAQNFAAGLGSMASFFSTGAQNVDFETGGGGGLGATFNFASRDPNTNEVSFNAGAFGFALGDIAVNEIGTRALAATIGVIISKTFGVNQPADAEALALGIRTDVDQTRTFLQQLTDPQGDEKPGGLPLLGGYAASLVYKQIVAKFNDNVDQAFDIFGWFAVQGRGKASFGSYTGKAGGRLQGNVGYTLDIE